MYTLAICDMHLPALRKTNFSVYYMIDNYKITTLSCYENSDLPLIESVCNSEILELREKAVLLTARTSEN